MNGADTEGIRIQLVGVRGKTVTSVRRIFYVFGDDVETSEGAVEFSFDDSSILLLDSGADGERLRVSTERWTDPFDGKMTPENIDYVARSGKYTAFDVGPEFPYSDILGRAVDGVELMTLPSGEVSGVSFLIRPLTISARTIADELIVSWESTRGGN
ncbi:hypothetical protein [Nocardia noduli]|uniref:hypothetical protein n=1 Tax=Nocardia noduli TaxID=2815722 RepID=UPI001C22BC80|nr:hypothetical protein [Nocardia noduli]